MHLLSITASAPSVVRFWSRIPFSVKTAEGLFPISHFLPLILHVLRQRQLHRPYPPMPESASAHPKAEPSSKQSNAIPIVIAVILGVVLLSFVIVQYGDSIMTLLKPEQGMPQDFDIEPPTTMTVDSGPDTAPPQTNESPSDPAQEPEPSPHYDPQDYETFEPATLADYNWVTYDIAHGILPTGMDRLESFEEIEGGWKLYIIDEPSGENSVTMERLCRCTFAEDEQGRGMRITWDYVHNNATDEGFEDHSPDSLYYGTWKDGVFDGLGTGGVTITDFWNTNGHEYAVGRISWPDGIHAVMYLARP